MEELIVFDAGSLDYLDAWELQQSLHRRVAEGAFPSVLLLLEHPHVYTLGRRSKSAHVLADQETLDRLGVQVHHADRGGEVTYHGPGQLVGYPILDLRRWGGGPLRYVRALEEILIATLGEFEVVAQRKKRPTGVWVGDAKIAAIGVKISRGVTTHGFALNVHSDLSFFDHIVPCGAPGTLVESMATFSEGIDVKTVVPVLAQEFSRVFGFSLRWADTGDEWNRFFTTHMTPRKIQGI